MTEFDFVGFENRQASELMKQGKTGKIIGIGNSITPILKSRQPVIVKPIKEDTILSKKDIVFCKVRGNYYLHLIHGIRNDSQFLIGNNHGHMNGWINKSQIFGKVVEILGK